MFYDSSTRGIALAVAISRKINPNKETVHKTKRNFTLFICSNKLFIIIIWKFTTEMKKRWNEEHKTLSAIFWVFGRIDLCFVLIWNDWKCERHFME